MQAVPLQSARKVRSAPLMALRSDIPAIASVKVHTHSSRVKLFAADAFRLKTQKEDFQKCLTTRYKTHFTPHLIYLLILPQPDL